MDDFASDTDSDYTSYWRDWVSAFDVLHVWWWQFRRGVRSFGQNGCWIRLPEGVMGEAGSTHNGSGFKLNGGSLREIQSGLKSFGSHHFQKGLNHAKG